MRPSIAISAIALCACGRGGISLDEYLAEKATLDANALVCQYGYAPGVAALLVEAQQQIERAQLERAVASGRAKFDGRKAKACLDQSPFHDAARCWGPSTSFDLRLFWRAASRGERPIECAQIFAGTVAAYGACCLDADCVSQTCRYSVWSVPARACAPTFAPGDLCSAYDSCPTTGFSACPVCPMGTRCTTSETTHSTCQPPGTPNKIAGAGCFYDDECLSGLLCIAGRCSTGVASGASCQSTDDCGIGLYCATSNPSQFACAPRLDAGAPCDEVGPQTDCSRPFQFTGISTLSCRGNQTCAGVQRDSKGQVIAPGRCVVPQDVGGACSRATGSPDPSTTGCYLGLVCDPATSKCAKPPGVGQPCVDGICDWGTAYCNACGGTCQPKKADGDACQFGDECQPSSVCGAGKCVPLSASCTEL